jgi:hypothetical protein
MSELHSFKRAVLAVPALPLQARAAVSFKWLRDAITRGDHNVLPLIKSFAKLRVHGHHAQAAYIKIFMQGRDVVDVLNEANEASQWLQEQVVYRLEFNSQLAAIPVDQLWNADIARRELLTLAERAAKNDKHKVASDALKLRASIRIN